MVVVGVVVVVVASDLATVAPRSVVLPKPVVLVVAAVASRSVTLPQHATWTVADTRRGSPPGSGSPDGTGHALGGPMDEQEVLTEYVVEDDSQLWPYP